MPLLLSIIIPSKTRDAPDLQRLLKSIERQTFRDYELLIETEGNSEEAKCRGILKAKGDILGFFCADNDLRDTRFLEVMVRYAQDPRVTGAYTAYYDYVPTDTPLSRYFALLGANDPLCWWLGKADRQSFLEQVSHTRTVRFSNGNLPSLGDNGFFIKRHYLSQVQPTPEKFGSCMCLCEDLRRLGYATYWVVAEQKLWHRTGEDFWDYFRRRWRYVNDLYWKKQAIRRWKMVEQPRDWLGVVGFALCSLIVVPNCLTSIRGYLRVRDPAWWLHPLVCFLLTGLYGTAWVMALWRQWSSQP